MLKVALLVAPVLACAPLASALTAELGPGASPAGEAACESAGPLDSDCALRMPVVGDEGPGIAVELQAIEPVAADLVDPAPHAAAGDFKEAAVEPGSVMPATLERDTRQRLVPALIALGAMVVLLRRRPTSF